MTYNRDSMPSPNPKNRLARDSNEYDAETLELLPFTNGSGRASPLPRLEPPRSLLRRALMRAKVWADKDARTRLVFRFLCLVAIAPFALATWLLLFLFGSGVRRTRAQHITRLGCGAFVLATLGFCVVAVLIACFDPSYTILPPQYAAFRQVCKASTELGRANPLDQRVFIAASLYDPKGELLNGSWARNVLELIDLIGPQNTHLSIYMSDSGDTGKEAMDTFATRVHSPHNLTSEAHVDIGDAPVIRLPDGAPATKRVEYLARARNLALKPLEEEGVFDKILYLNDVLFDPIEAAQLIFLTNTKPYDMPSKQKSNYRAACALDFDDIVKYYDTFASRDSEGFALGLPVYPWFTKSGQGQSRQDVLEQRDAVRVKSCWGGMVSFDARYFQQRMPTQLLTTTEADTLDSRAADVPFRDVVRFRSVPELDVEFSECCLIHADLAAAPPAGPPHLDGTFGTKGSGIFMNPYIRTAYSERVLKYNWIGRRFEKVLLPFQGFVNTMVGLPVFNERRTINKGDSIVKTIWEPSPNFNASTAGRLHYDDSDDDESAVQTRELSPAGQWVRKSVLATTGEFCADFSLMIRRLEPLPGKQSWEKYKVPLSGDIGNLNKPDKA